MLNTKWFSVLSSLFFVRIHIYTSTDKFHILANNWPIKDVLCDQRWFRKTKCHIVQLGLGQSKRLKSFPTTTTHCTNMQTLKLIPPPLPNFFYSPPPLPKLSFDPHPLYFNAPPPQKKNRIPPPKIFFLNKGGWRFKINLGRGIKKKWEWGDQFLSLR